MLLPRQIFERIYFCDGRWNDLKSTSSYSETCRVSWKKNLSQECCEHPRVVSASNRALGSSREAQSTSNPKIISDLFGKYLFGFLFSVLRINNPEKFNALTGSMMLDFSKVMDEVEKFDGTAIVLTGEGKAFCSGSDLRNGFAQANDAFQLSFGAKETFVFKRSKSHKIFWNSSLTPFLGFFIFRKQRKPEKLSLGVWPRILEFYMNRCVK